MHIRLIFRHDYTHFNKLKSTTFNVHFLTITLFHMHIRTRTHTHTHTHTLTHTHTHTYTHTRTHAHTHTHAHMHTYPCTLTRMHTCTYTHTHMYAHTHTRTYIYTLITETIFYSCITFAWLHCKKTIGNLPTLVCCMGPHVMHNFVSCIRIEMHGSISCRDRYA